MDFFIKETGYFPYNQMVHNRLQTSLLNEKHFYEYQKNRFPISLKQAENDFFIKPVFKNTKDSFIENWLLYPFDVDKGTVSSLTIESKPLNGFEDLTNIFTLYGFNYFGRLNFYHSEEDLKPMMTDYFQNHFSAYSKYTVSLFFDSKANCLSIQNYFKSESGIKIYFILGRYWFIPEISEENSFSEDLCKTAKFLLNGYDLLNIFGQKK